MAKLAVCLTVLLVLLVALAESSTAKYCCSDYQEIPVPQKNLKYYKIQVIGFCNMKAVIFKTVRNRVFCAHPDRQWVRDAMASTPHKP